jgi:hypothetical protein
MKALWIALGIVGTIPLVAAAQYPAQSSVYESAPTTRSVIKPVGYHGFGKVGCGCNEVGALLLLAAAHPCRRHRSAIAARSRACSNACTAACDRSIACCPAVSVAIRSTATQVVAAAVAAAAAQAAPPNHRAARAAPRAGLTSSPSANRSVKAPAA